MAYTPETISSNTYVSSTWGNKIEQELAKLGNYMGGVALVADLPSTPETGNFYLVQEKASFYYWTGSKWQVIGGGAPALIVGDESTVTTTSATYISIKTLTLIQSSFIRFAQVVARVTLYTSAGTVYARLGADSDAITSTEVSTTSTSEVAEEITLDVSNLADGAHTIGLEMHVDDSANTGTNVVFELWGVPA